MCKKDFMNYGIIDIGSNTVRIVVYEVSGNRFERMFNKKIFVQLIGYVKDGIMTDQGIRKLILCIQELQHAASYFHPVRIVGFATAPFRALKSAGNLVDMTRTVTGLNVEVLTGETEAKLGLIGARHSTGIQDGLFVDLGGGSMEASLLLDGKIRYAQSIDLGCVTLCDRFVSNILPSRAEQKQIKDYVDIKARGFEWLGQARGLSMHCIGGTARALGRIHRTLWDSVIPLNVYRMDIKDIKTVCQTIIGMKTAGIRLMSNQCAGRIFTFVPGAIALWRLGKGAGAADVRFCTYGVREGYLISRIMAKPSLPAAQAPSH